MHKRKLTIFILIILSITFLIHFSIRAIANDTSVDCEDESQPVPTLTGNAEYPENWYCPCDPYIPLEFDPNNPEEINPGASITISVLDGCPPFLWDDPGNGYTWANGTVVDPEQPKIKKTNERINTLQCASGT